MSFLTNDRGEQVRLNGERGSLSSVQCEFPALIEKLNHAFLRQRITDPLHANLHEAEKILDDAHIEADVLRRQLLMSTFFAASASRVA